MKTALRLGLAVATFLLLFSGAAVGASGHGAGHAAQHKQKKVTDATFGAAPASSTGPNGQTGYSFSASPGATLSDYVEVLNYSYKPQRLSVYTVDAVPSSTGLVSFQPRTAKRLQAGAWMSVGTPRGRGYVVLRPRATEILPVHIRVPKNASPGDHVGAVVVSLLGKVTSKFGHSGGNVGFEQRIAVQAEFRISGAVHPRLSIENLKGSYSGPIDPFADGTAKLSYVLKNSGNVIIGGPQAVTIHGLFGKTVVAKAVPSVPALLPGAVYPVTVTIPKIYPQLLMTGKVTITEGGVQGQIDPGLHPISASVHFLAIPWVIVIAILVVLFLIAFAVWRRRRRSAQADVGRQRTPDPQGVSA